MKNKELFDHEVERFLRKEMSAEEETAFKRELASDPQKLSRAKAIAFAIKQMKNSAKANDTCVVKNIKDTDENTYKKIVSGEFELKFDDRVNLYLKSQMSKKEEQEFLKELAASPELLLRAKAIAFAVSQMKGHGKEHDEKIIEAIKKIPMKDLKKLIPNPLVLQCAKKARIQYLGTETQAVNGIGIFEVAKRIDLRDRRTGSIRQHKVLRWCIGVAASFLILFGGFHLYDINHTKGLGNSYGNVFNSQQMLSRSVSDTIVTSKLATMFSYVQKGDSLSVAIDFLSKAYEADGKYSIYKDYNDCISWNLAIAYLKDGNKKKAKKILERIPLEYPDTPLATKAKELLEEL